MKFVLFVQKDRYRFSQNLNEKKRRAAPRKSEHPFVISDFYCTFALAIGSLHHVIKKGIR